jgi:hypothetical protein
MDYNVIASDRLAELIRRVNDYREIGYTPIGGIAVVRERISGPVSYFQAIFNGNGRGLKAQSRRPRGRPKGSFKRDNGVHSEGD